MVKQRPGYQANRARISLALSEFTVPRLSRIDHAFDGDMVAAIVLGEIAHRNVEAWLAEHRNPEEILHDPSRRTTVMRPCNALSIAEACGLPRETVRRKVVLLAKRGYIYRSEDGHLYLTRKVGTASRTCTPPWSRNSSPPRAGSSRCLRIGLRGWGRCGRIERPGRAIGTQAAESF